MTWNWGGVSWTSSERLFCFQADSALMSFLILRSELELSVLIILDLSFIVVVPRRCAWSVLLFKQTAVFFYMFVGVFAVYVDFCFWFCLSYLHEFAILSHTHTHIHSLNCHLCVYGDILCLRKIEAYDTKRRPQPKTTKTW